MSKKKLRIKPFGTIVVVEVDKTEEISNGGIVLTSSTMERGQMEASTGTLVEVGDMAYQEYKAANYDYPKVGEKVYFKKYSGIIVTDKPNKREFRSMQDEDVYASPEWIENED